MAGTTLRPLGCRTTRSVSPPVRRLSAANPPHHKRPAAPDPIGHGPFDRLATIPGQAGAVPRVLRHPRRPRLPKIDPATPYMAVKIAIADGRQPGRHVLDVEGGGARPRPEIA